MALLITSLAPEAFSAPSAAEQAIINQNNALLEPLNRGLADGGAIHTMLAQIQSRVDANRAANPALDDSLKKVEADLARFREVINAWREILTAQNSLYEADTRNNGPIFELCRNTHNSQWLQARSAPMRERLTALSGAGYSGELNEPGSSNAEPVERRMLLQLLRSSNNLTLLIQRRCTDLTSERALQLGLEAARALGGTPIARDAKCEDYVRRGIATAEGCQAHFNEDGTPAREAPRQGLGRVIVPGAPPAVVTEPNAAQAPRDATPRGQLPGDVLQRGGHRPGAQPAR